MVMAAISTNLFGFVSFHHIVKVMRAITNLHGIEIQRCKLSMQVAAYGRNQHEDPKVRRRVVQRFRLKLITRGGRSFKEVLMGRNDNLKASAVKYQQGFMLGQPVKIIAKKKEEKERPNDLVFVTGEVCEEMRELLD